MADQSEEITAQDVVYESICLCSAPTNCSEVPSVSPPCPRDFETSSSTHDESPSRARLCTHVHDPLRIGVGSQSDDAGSTIFVSAKPLTHGDTSVAPLVKLPPGIEREAAVILPETLEHGEDLPANLVLWPGRRQTLQHDGPVERAAIRRGHAHGVA